MKQSERDELLIRLDERTHDIYKEVKTIKRTLFGNGQEGLVYVVNRHKTYFAILIGALSFLAGTVLKIMFLR